MDNTTIFALVAVAGIGLYALSGDNKVPPPPYELCDEKDGEEPVYCDTGYQEPKRRQRQGAKETVTEECPHCGEHIYEHMVEFHLHEQHPDIFESPFSPPEATSIAEADIIDDEPGAWDGGGPGEADIPPEQRVGSEELKKYFLQMMERYSNTRFHTNDIVGYINRRFADICSSTTQYLEDKHFSFEMLADIRQNTRVVEHQMTDLITIIEGVENDGDYDYHGELWKTNGLPRLNNTKVNYEYMWDKLGEARIFDE